MAVLVASEADLRQGTLRTRCAGTERDLVFRPLAHEIAARVLEQERRTPRARDRAALHVEQSRGELGERGLARAVRAGERDDLAAAQLERDAIEDPWAVAVRIGRSLHAADDVSPGPRPSGRAARLDRPRRAMLLEPGDRLIARRVEQHAPAVEERDAIGVRQRKRRMLLGEDDRRADVERMVEEGLRALGIELRRRLIEQQQLRSECERRGEADALQLPARELRDAAAGEVRRPDRVERVRRTLCDLARRRADVLEAERDLRLDSAEHDLVLGILEDGRDGAGQLGGPRAARVAAGDLHPALERSTVEPRDEPGERTQDGRLPRARRPEQQQHLARLDRQRHLVEREPAVGIREREPGERR